MRNYIKRIIGVCLSVFVLVTGMSQEISAASDSAAILNDLGLLLNISEAELNQTLTREVGLTMILKSLGFEQADADQAVQNGYFIDTEGWSKGWAELAYTEGITNGTGGKQFSPKSMLSKKEFVAFQLRALGYDTTTAWTDADVLGRSSGLLSADEGVEDSFYTKEEASEIMYNALSAEVVGTGMDLVDKLVDEGVVSKTKVALYGFSQEKFAISSIIADNLKTISVKFTGSVDIGSLSADSIEITRGSIDLLYDDDYTDGISASGFALKLVNGDQVDILLGLSQKQGTELGIILKGIEDVFGNKATTVNEEVTLVDNTVPKFVSAEMVNPVYLAIQASEPVQIKVGKVLYYNILIDNKKVTATGSISKDYKTIYLKFDEALEEGDHSLEISEVYDFAGLISGVDEFVITSLADNKSPEIVTAEALSRDQVILTFDEILNPEEGEITLNGTTYELDDDDDQTYLSIDENTVKVELVNPLSASAATSGAKGSYDDIEDMVGNQVKNDVSFSYKAPYDTIIPTVSLEVNDSNEIILTFSEPVQEFSSSFFALSKFDDEGEESLVSTVTSGFVGSSEEVYRIRLSDPLVDAVEYDFSIMSIKDKSVFQNKLVSYETTITMLDKNQPTVESVKYLSDEIIRISFSESMDKSKLKDPIYYTYHDESEDVEYSLKDIKHEITLDPDNEYVDIEIDGLVSSDRIEVGKLSDLSGLIITTAGRIYSLGSVGSFTYADVEAVLMDLKTIKVTADGHEFDYVDSDDFLLKSGSSESDTHYIRTAAIDEEDSSILYLGLSSALDGNARADGKKQYLYMAEDVITRDTFNQELDIPYTKPVQVIDETRATLSIDDSETDTLIVEFSEVVGAGSNSEVISDIFLRDEDGDLVSLTVGDNVTFDGGNDSYSFFDTITIDGLVGGETYTIEIQSRYIEDDNGNTMIKLSKTAVKISE